MSLPADDELVRRGILDPSAPDASERRDMVALLIERGATLDEIEAAAGRLSGFVLEVAMRPGRATLSLAEAAGRAGLSEETAARIWRAFGFPDPIASGRRFAPEDAEALRLFGDVQRLLGIDHAFELARVAGSSLARIADAAVAAIRVSIETPLRREGAGEFWFAGIFETLIDELMPRMFRAFETLQRQFLSETTIQHWSIDEGSAATTRNLAVGFADIVDFTARSRSLPTHDLATGIDRFEREAADAIARHGGRLVKLIGDAAMFAVASADAACAIALDLVAMSGSEGAPEVRAGIALGPVISRAGDYYGPVVNVASRLTDLARPGEVLAAEAIHGNVTPDRFRLTPTPPRPVKGLDEPLVAYRVSRRCET